MDYDAEIRLFESWFAEATQSEPNDPNAMFLATVDDTGLPNIRVVLMKSFNLEGFIFYTNLESAKGVELLNNPQSTACFNWKSMQRQVIINGVVEAIPGEVADAYFNSRPLKSRIGAWASQQSRPLKNRATLLARATGYALKLGSGTILRPPYWGGFLLRPTQMGFLSEGRKIPIG